MFGMNSSTTGPAGVIVTVGAASLLLAGCSSSLSPADGDSAAAGACAGKKIAFVVGAESDPFFQAMKVGAQDEATRRGAVLIWQGDRKEYSPATQIPVVDRVLAQKPFGLVLIPTDPDALQPSVTKAVDVGVIVANVDTRVTDLRKVLTFITGENSDGGAKAADAIAGAIGYADGG